MVVDKGSNQSGILELAKQRKSCREFSDKRIDKKTLDKFIEISQFAPSAGGFKPFAIIALKKELNDKLVKICLNQEFMGNATNIVLAVSPFGMLTKYGQRGWRYIYMEAGHIAQNICLLATELGLGSCCIGAFDDRELAHLIPNYVPIYIVSIGVKI